MLFLETGGTTLLNVNDCRVNDAAQALRIRSVTGPVDVLFTQFSYANWVGNPNEVERRRAYADLMLSYVRTQIEIFEPRYVVPFASFVRFCHAENAYLTAELPRLRDVVEYIDTHTRATPIALYPGDTWSSGKPTTTMRRSPATRRTWPNQLPSERHRAHCRSGVVRTVKRARAPPAQPVELDGDHSRTRSGRFLRPVRIRLWDLDCTVEFRCNRGLRETTEPPHIEMGTDSLAFCFEQDFGAETLYVNGRYRIVQGPEKLFFRHFYPAILNNQGYSFPLGAAQFVLSDRVSWRLRAVREALHIGKRTRKGRARAT